MFTLDAIMTTELITLLPTANLAEARELMHRHKIHHLPVEARQHLLDESCRIAAALERARAAQKEWAKVSIARRAEIVRGDAADAASA